MRYFVRVRDNPQAGNYGQPLSLHRFSEDGKEAEFWDRKTEAWQDAPGIIRFTGIGGETDAFEVDEAMAYGVFLQTFGGDPELAKEAMGLDYEPVLPMPPGTPPLGQTGEAPPQPAPAEPEVRGALRRLHYGPGEHPGTGTPQEAHAGNGGEGDEGRREDAPSRIAGFVHPSPGRYREALNTALADSPFKHHVSHYSAEELAGMKALLLSEDGKAGIAVKDHGDGRIEGTALFSTGTPAGLGRKLLLAASEDFEVNYVEAFMPFLPDLYRQIGFRVDQTFPFDRDQAPAGWDYKRFDEPGYVTMRREG